MRPRINKCHSPNKLIQVGLASACTILLSYQLAAAADPGSVVARDTLSRVHREELIAKLRLITGWRDLAFNGEGFLKIGATQPEDGSQLARELLVSAVRGRTVIVLEDATSRSDVAFCRVVPGKWVGEPRSQPVYVVLIDFADFQQITGDNKARAAFDVGWGLLHEIDHVVNDSRDPQGATLAGDCEDHINEMRRELGLPLRAGYFFTPLSLRTDPNFTTRLVRLGFVQPDTASSKRKRYWLVWDAAVVGGSTEQWQTALVQPSSSRSR
jgi:hypothetical protein